MEKKCFVIMPTSEPAEYASGHFNRVYDYIIAPACRMAGFWPSRADSPNDAALDVIKNIIDSDIVLCDLSANNFNAPYGLAIRQALNLPVILIKDMKTHIMYEGEEFGHVGYDESLRIDTVQKEVEILKEAMDKCHANKPEPNPLLNRLRIGPGQIVITSSYSVDTASIFTPSMDETAVQEEEKPQPKEVSLPIISPLPDYVGDPITDEDIEKLKVGDFIFHLNFGKGEIKMVKKISKDKIADIHFEAGSKILVLGTSGFFRSIL
jgi:hypothetical protein